MKQNRTFPIRFLFLSVMLLGLILFARMGEEQSGTTWDIMEKTLPVNSKSFLQSEDALYSDGEMVQNQYLYENLMQNMFDENRTRSLMGQNEEAIKAEDSHLLIRVLITAPDGSYGWTRKEIMESDLLTKYPGEMLIADSLLISANGEELYYVINHVDLEIYLSYVVQAEMPADFPLEALKAQAVCARTYAIKQMRQERLSAYYADVDDTEMFQVYKIFELSERVVEAVEATRGEVLVYEEEPIWAYYYSCCGGTSTTDAIWDYENLHSEPYLSSHNYGELEKACPWYRWTLLSEEGVHDTILERIQERSMANKDSVTANFDDLNSFGAITDMEITSRLAGDVVHCLKICSGNQVIEIWGEYNIRYVLGGECNTILLQDGTQKELNLVPSGFFQLQIVKSGDEIVQYFISGQGFGHGVGMSQYGANYLADRGINYSEILTNYFSDVNIITIDDLQRIK